MKITIVFILGSVLILLISGSIIGYLIGGYIIQERWEGYNKEREARIAAYCNCDYNNYQMPKFNLFQNATKDT